MRRILMLALIAVFAVVSVPAAQAEGSAMDNLTWYAAGNLAIPFRDWSDFAGLGFGGAIGARLPHNDNLTFRGEAGFTKFGGKDIDVVADTWSYSYSMIPILALCEYGMDPDSPLYLVGGLGFINRRVSIDAPSNGFIDISGSTSDTEIGLVAGGGFRASDKFDVEARLNLVSDSSTLSAQGVVHF